MRVFVTGASGYVGSAVVAALLARGHEVTGLVRSGEKAAALRAAGAVPALGALDELPRHRVALSSCEALVHCAFDPAQGPPADEAAIQALLGALHGTTATRALVYTSGVWVLGATAGPTGEDGSTAHPARAVAWRPAHERRVLEAASGSLSTCVLRPGIVYGGRGGLVAGFFASAAAEGAARVVGDGRNRWPLVHRADLGLLYALAVERRARGVLHGVDGAAVRVGDVAHAASTAAGAAGRLRHVPVGEAVKEMGPVAEALALDQEVTAPRALELGWRPAWRPFPESAAAAYAEWRPPA